MTNTVLKNHLYKAIEKIDDSIFLEAIYKIISTKVEDSEVIKLSDKQKQIFNERKKNHQNGTSESHHWDDVKKQARKSRTK